MSKKDAAADSVAQHELLLTLAHTMPESSEVRRSIEASLENFRAALAKTINDANQRLQGIKTTYAAALLDAALQCKLSPPAVNIQLSPQGEELLQRILGDERPRPDVVLTLRLLVSRHYSNEPSLTVRDIETLLNIGYAHSCLSAIRTLISTTIGGEWYVNQAGPRKPYRYSLCQRQLPDAPKRNVKTKKGRDADLQ